MFPKLHDVIYGQPLIYILKLLSATTAGMAGCMQGGVYAFSTRALPKLTQEEDLDIRLSVQEASWFGELKLQSYGAIQIIHDNFLALF